MEKRGLKEKNNQSAGAHASAKDTPPKSLPTPAMMVVAGSIVLGQMDAAAAAAINRAAAPIHLPEGLAGRRGFGLLHVESTPGRVAAISGARFPMLWHFMPSSGQQTLDHNSNRTSQRSPIHLCRRSPQFADRFGLLHVESSPGQHHYNQWFLRTPNASTFIASRQQNLDRDK